MDIPTFGNKLRRLAYRRFEKLFCSGKELIGLLHATACERDRERLRTLIQWFTVPLTQWIIDVFGLSEHFRATQAGHEPHDPRYDFLYAQIARMIPCEEEQESVIPHEHDVEAGNYDHLLLNPAKYTVEQKAIAEDPERIQQWEWIKKNFNLKRFGPRGVINRTLRKERNMVSSRFHRAKEPDKERWLFNAIFDLYCAEWSLYGMSGDYPLLDKLRINRTPFGTEVFVPKWLNVDWRRDINSVAFQKVHWRPEQVRRSAKRAVVQGQDKQMLKRVLEGFDLAKKDKMRGRDRLEFIAQHAGLHPDTDGGTLRRHRRNAEALRKRGEL